MWTPPFALSALYLCISRALLHDSIWFFPLVPRSQFAVYRFTLMGVLFCHAFKLNLWLCCCRRRRRRRRFMLYLDGECFKRFLYFDWIIYSNSFYYLTYISYTRIGSCMKRAHTAHGHHVYVIVASPGMEWRNNLRGELEQCTGMRPICQMLPTTDDDGLRELTWNLYAPFARTAFRQHFCIVGMSASGARLLPLHEHGSCPCKSVYLRFNFFQFHA